MKFINVTQLIWHPGIHNSLWIKPKCKLIDLATERMSLSLPKNKLIDLLKLWWQSSRNSSKKYPSPKCWCSLYCWSGPTTGSIHSSCRFLKPRYQNLYQWVFLSVLFERVLQRSEMIRLGFENVRGEVLDDLDYLETQTAFLPHLLKMMPWSRDSSVFSCSRVCTMRTGYCCSTST